MIFDLFRLENNFCFSSNHNILLILLLIKKLLKTNMLENNQKNIFVSKSYVLEYLSSKLKKSKIEKSYKFEIKDWVLNSNEIIKTIVKIFKSEKIIVRSSAKGEDSILKSEAGLYASILNVKSNSKSSIKNAIKTVIQSYNKNKNYNQKNQILIQKQTKDVWISGVIFTRISDTNAPYYVINYDKSKSTDKVTSGQNSKIIKIFRNTQDKNLQKHWKKLIKSVQEIEQELNNTHLDIEFAINLKNEIIIFQVRPITTINKKNINIKDKQISNNLNKQKINFLQFVKKHDYKKTIFSDMSDWNPVEIIGNDPHMLDYSLYNYLIMKNAWMVGRTKIGYQKVDNSSLMIKFGNHPYVNIQKSFQSLIPNNFDKKIKKKMINFYLKKLEKNPQYYDKVEFEILFTCYDLTIQNRLNELLKNGFTKQEILKIESNLIEFTNEIIQQFPIISSNSTKNIEKMNSRRNKILKTITKESSVNDYLDAIENLLKDCKQYGTTPFSTMARIAFISSILLKSFVTKKKSKNFYDLFMNNISTVVSEFQIDLQNMYKKKITKKIFLKKYGHLRPGTYDITILPYRQNNTLLQNFNIKKRKKNKDINFSDINKILKKTKLKFINVDFLDFVKLSLIRREEIKFEFTKNLSEAIELLAIAGKKLGFTRNELSNLSIHQILRSFRNKSDREIQNNWRNHITVEIKKRKLNNFLVLPPIISTVSDFEIIQYHISMPNYITDKKIKSKLFKLNIHKKITGNFENKIILIENADPGYDWIFLKNLSGLITKYGGIISHMAIRCAELEIPAAIGCGELIYEKLLLSSKIMLDCKNKQISILENQVEDQFIEERKVLKTLGYIK